jgi:hypothetical protein
MSASGSHHVHPGAPILLILLILLILSKPLPLPFTAAIPTLAS